VHPQSVTLTVITADIASFLCL